MKPVPTPIVQDLVRRLGTVRWPHVGQVDKVVGRAHVPVAQAPVVPVQRGSGPRPVERPTRRGLAGVA